MELLLCRPSYFSVDYIINPWMKPGSVDKNRALEQWNNLHAAYQNLGIKINVIEQKKGFPDMVFAADQGIIEDQKILLSNFRYPQRKGESQFYKQWFKERNYEIIELPNDVFFEGGGETLKWNGTYFMGTGFRSSEQAGEYLSKTFDKQVVELELIDNHFYHLDTCLFPISSSIVFYYPEAFSEKSITVLKKLVPELVPFTKQEAYQFSANGVVIDKNVLIQNGCESFAKKLTNLHFNPIEIDVSEFIKAGGGIHCLTCFL